MVYGLHACGRTAVPMAPTRDMRSAGYCFRRRQTRCGVCSVPGRSIYGRAASVQARCLTASGPTLRRTHRRGADGRAGMHLACRRACICCPGTPRFPWMHAFLLGVFLTRPRAGFFFFANVKPRPIRVTVATGSRLRRRWSAKSGLLPTCVECIDSPSRTKLAVRLEDRQRACSACTYRAFSFAMDSSVHPRNRASSYAVRPLNIFPSASRGSARCRDAIVRSPPVNRVPARISFCIRAAGMKQEATKP